MNFTTFYTNFIPQGSRIRFTCVGVEKDIVAFGAGTGTVYVYQLHFGDCESLLSKLLRHKKSVSPTIPASTTNGMTPANQLYPEVPQLTLLKMFSLLREGQIARVSVTHVSPNPSIRGQFAIGTSDCMIHIVQVPLNGKGSETVLARTSVHAPHLITCLLWHPSGLELFSGSESGQVVRSTGITVAPGESL